MKKTVLLILAILPALLFFPSCEKRDLVEEQMELLEGKWASTQNGLMPDDPAYYAEVTKEGGKWVFRFHIMDTKTQKVHTTVQGVTWNPIVGTYVFERVSDQGKTHYESDKIILAYIVEKNSLGDRDIYYYAWKRVPDSL